MWKRASKSGWYLTRAASRFIISTRTGPSTITAIRNAKADFFIWTFPFRTLKWWFCAAWISGWFRLFWFECCSFFSFIGILIIGIVCVIEKAFSLLTNSLSMKLGKLKVSFDDTLIFFFVRDLKCIFVQFEWI